MYMDMFSQRAGITKRRRNRHTSQSINNSLIIDHNNPNSALLSCYLLKVRPNMTNHLYYYNAIHGYFNVIPKQAK